MAVPERDAIRAADGSTVSPPIPRVPGASDRPYPSGHAKRLDRMADLGLLMSETPPGQHSQIAVHSASRH